MHTPWLRGRPWRGLWRRPAGVTVALLVVVVSWIRTEGGLDHHANRLVDFADAVFGTALLEGCALRDGGRRQLSGHPHPDCLVAPEDLQERRIARTPWIPKLATFTLTHDHWLAGIWLDEGATWNPLARTDLEGVELVDLPEAWRTPETARAAFRKAWCEREGLSMAVCDHPPSLDRPTPATRAAARTEWCSSEGTDAAACRSQFDDLDARFEAAWAEERSANIANLPRLTLAGRDLRNVAAAKTSLVDADLFGARLEGADLSGARLESANLFRARLEGADLFEARLERADLNEARLEGANFGAARLEGADLVRARLKGADLFMARLEGADLGGAHLVGANFGEARLEGANLFRARLEGAELFRARLEGADLRYANFRGSRNWTGASILATPAQFADFRGAQGLTQDQLDQMVGNGQTLLPDTGTLTIPSCWKTPPYGFNALVERVGGREPRRPGEIRAEFLCPEGQEPRRTGTRLPLDAPYPEGHPLAGR
jgi:uncharacterized protein YjbI with pentapeptide repeats